ncbi:MAG TPA: hypothetical protein VM871_03030, partial [Flavisolibacter sp.]|nr:hypothetical protein [Flavisolibacter sp.]
MNSLLPATVAGGFTTAKKIASKYLALSMAASLLTFAATAQTYTTKKAGNWSSASTWENGNIPSTTIGTGQTVNIKHAVLYNTNTDLSISGKLNITNDTLRFPLGFDKKTLVAATGLFYVKNGGFLQIISDNKAPMEIDGGRIILENGYLGISKNVVAKPGTVRTYKNSVVRVGEKYEVDGTSTKRNIDTVLNSYVEIGLNSTGDFEIKDYCTLRVSNATMTTTKGKFKVNANAEVKVLPNAAGNFGFDLLKAGEDLENDGAWDARIDAYCIGKDIKGSNMAAIDFTRDEDCNDIAQTGELTEIAFSNPVLKSGTAKKEGAVYRFANVT